MERVNVGAIFALRRNDLGQVASVADYPIPTLPNPLVSYLLQNRF